MEYVGPVKYRSYRKKILKTKNIMMSDFNLSTGLCKHSQHGAYTVASRYNWIRHKGEQVHWFKMIWHEGRIPICAFITWLMTQ